MTPGYDRRRQPDDNPKTYHDRLAVYRRHLRMERAVRLWAGRIAYTLGTVGLTAAAVYLVTLAP